MNVSGRAGHSNTNLIRVALTSGPILHPFSSAPGATQNYYCLALDMKGFQIQVDLQALPAGVSVSQLQANQVWWVEKRSSLYRLQNYGGVIDPNSRVVNSTAPLPPYNAGTVALVSGVATVQNTTVVSGSIIMLTAQSLINVSKPQALSVSSINPGVSFSIQSASGVDNSIIGWKIY